MPLPLIEILIPTTDSRFHYIKTLLEFLYNEIDMFHLPIKISVNYDNKIKTVGQKRQELLNNANSEYILFIDDDDDFHGLIDVCDAIVKNKRPDAITYNLKFHVDGDLMSIWHIHAVPKTMELKRIATCLLHVCPIKTVIAKQVPFVDKVRGEDTQWSKEIAKLINTEHHINDAIYYYYFVHDKNKAEQDSNNISKQISKIEPGIYDGRDYLNKIDTAINYNPFRAISIEELDKEQKITSLSKKRGRKPKVK